MIFYTNFKPEELVTLDTYDKVYYMDKMKPPYVTPIKVLKSNYYEVFYVSEGLRYTYNYNIETLTEPEKKDYLFNENNMVYFSEEEGLIKVSDGNNDFEIEINKTEYTLNGRLLIDHKYKATLTDMKYRREFDMLSKVKQETYLFTFNHDITITIELFEKLNT